MASEHEASLHATENGLRVGSDDWLAAASKSDDPRLRMQYYGMSKEQYDDLARDKGATVDRDILQDVKDRAVSFVDQGGKDYVAEQANQKLMKNLAWAAAAAAVVGGLYYYYYYYA